jgi:ribulose-phosphate 3-epimerase
VEKIKKLAAIKATIRSQFMIEVDGGIGIETIAEVVRAGAEILVCGNAVFGSGDAKLNTERLLKAGREANLVRV